MDISNLTSLINALRAERMFLITHKKRHCFSAMSLLLVWITHKKRHCFSAMSLLGARWDSNP